MNIPSSYFKALSAILQEGDINLSLRRALAHCVNGQLFFVATTREMMIVINTGVEIGLPDEFKVLFDPAVIAENDPVSVSYKSGKLCFEFSNMVIELSQDGLEKEYPCYKNAVNNAISRSKMCSIKVYNPNFLARLQKVAVLLGAIDIPIVHNNYVVDFGVPNAFGIVLSLNEKWVTDESYHRDGNLPGWFIN